jgi:hypothetical protein
MEVTTRFCAARPRSSASASASDAAGGRASWRVARIVSGNAAAASSASDPYPIELSILAWSVSAVPICRAANSR